MKRIHSAHLFPDENTIAQILNVTPAEWRGIATVLEREGFPRIDPLIGRRYWPAILKFWQTRYGLRGDDIMSPVDGKDNFDALR